MTGRVLTASDFGRSASMSVDYAIIGSGAGGAVCAARLAEAGASVLILEEGGLYTREDFSLREADAYQKMYQQRGNLATEDLSMIVLQGRSVGGGTTVNWTTTFRTPDYVLDHWQRVHGVSGFSSAELAGSFDEVEQRLGIHQVDLSQVNPNNHVLLSGAKKLGLRPELLARNTRGCMQTGYCGMGCPTNAKQAMHLTYLPDAVRAGADLFANTRVLRLEAKGRSVVSLEAAIMDAARYQPSSTRLKIKARTVILSGGAINSPALLLRSGLRNSSGLVGQRTFLHPVSIVLGFQDSPVRGFSGIPQSVGLREGVDRATQDRMGYFLETPPIHPLMAALACPGFGERQAEIMRRLEYVSATIALCIDGFEPLERCGTVEVKGSGQTTLNYDYTPKFWNTVRESTELMAKIAFAGGSREVWTTHETPLRMTSERDLQKLRSARYGPHLQTLASAHQMGGCQMGGNRNSSVVSPELKHWDYDNLYVIDGSVLPTAAGVNPSETIYALAHLATGRLL